MAVKQVGQNSAEEFFETILYMTAYNEAQTLIKEYTKDIENPVIKEAVESAMNVLVFGAVMHLVRYQEAIIEKVFGYAEAIALALLLKGRKIMKNSLKGLKGSKLLSKLGFFQSSTQEDLMIAQIAVTHIGNKAHVKTFNNVQNGTSSYNALQMANDTKQTIYQRENLHLNFGNAMASRYNETLLFKLFTKSFTANDEMLIKKILGRDTASVVNVNDLNQVADFLFVKDTNGQIMGLSEAFFSLVNGLAYVHNKA